MRGWQPTDLKGVDHRQIHPLAPITKVANSEPDWQQQNSLNMNSNFLETFMTHFMTFTPHLNQKNYMYRTEGFRLRVQFQIFSKFHIPRSS